MNEENEKGISRAKTAFLNSINELSDAAKYLTNSGRNWIGNRHPLNKIIIIGILGWVFGKVFETFLGYIWTGVKWILDQQIIGNIPSYAIGSDQVIMSLLGILFGYLWYQNKTLDRIERKLDNMVSDPVLMADGGYDFRTLLDPDTTGGGAIGGFIAGGVIGATFDIPGFFAGALIGTMLGNLIEKKLSSESELSDREYRILSTICEVSPNREFTRSEISQVIEDTRLTNYVLDQLTEKGYLEKTCQGGRQIFVIDIGAHEQEHQFTHISDKEAVENMALQVLEREGVEIFERSDLEEMDPIEIVEEVNRWVGKKELVLSSNASRYRITEKGKEKVKN